MIVLLIVVCGSRLAVSTASVACLVQNDIHNFHFAKRPFLETSRISSTRQRLGERSKKCSTLDFWYQVSNPNLGGAPSIVSHLFDSSFNRSNRDWMTIKVPINAEPHIGTIFFGCYNDLAKTELHRGLTPNKSYQGAIVYNYDLDRSRPTASHSFGFQLTSGKSEIAQIKHRSPPPEPFDLTLGGF